MEKKITSRVIHKPTSLKTLFEKAVGLINLTQESRAADQMQWSMPYLNTRQQPKIKVRLINVSLLAVNFRYGAVLP